MFYRHSVLFATLALTVGACSDSMAPRRTGEPLPIMGSHTAPHILRAPWAGTVQPHFSAVGAVSEAMVSSREPGLFTSSGAGLGLTAYQATFWAVNGQTRSLQINYSGGGGTQRFLLLTTTNPTYAPGQGTLAVGDSVLVTTTVDPKNVLVDLQPTGMLFGTPGKLKIWYGGAGGDLNGDGVVNSTDAMIAQQLLGIWYQEGSTAPWVQIAATKSLTEQWVESNLYHFSNYSVAF